MCLGVHIIIIVAGRLTLQDVAVLQEDDVVLVGLAQIVDVRGYARQGSRFGLAVDEVVWKESSMNITRLNYSQFYGTLLCHCLRIKGERHEERCEQLFHIIFYLLFKFMCKITKKLPITAYFLLDSY